jgi:AcrR family transcriptional regulator
MAVYRHVRDKEALLGALCDAVLADLAPFEPDRPWRPQVERFAWQLRDALAARPSLAAVLAGAPVTPAAVALTQQAIVLMTDRDVPLDVAVGGLATVFAYIIGFAVTEASLPDARRARTSCGEQPCSTSATPPPSRRTSTPPCSWSRPPPTSTSAWTSSWRGWSEEAPGRRPPPDTQRGPASVPRCDRNPGLC